MEKLLEEYLHTHIPISQAMGVRVEQASAQKVILFAPFANNINHKQTVFGGSLHAVATLACWGLLYVNLRLARDDHAQIVIAKSEVNYLAPVDADFRAECVAPEESIRLRFLKILEAKGKARIQLSAAVHHKGRLAVDYQAVFAALEPSKKAP